ncbi:WD repeat-containing protein 70 [Varanus komodoensis]|nr:WD repeat-containing protein 70 [Varanus komodoensis]
MEGDAEAVAGPDPELAATMGFSGFGELGEKRRGRSLGWRGWRVGEESAGRSERKHGHLTSMQCLNKLEELLWKEVGRFWKNVKKKQLRKNLDASMKLQQLQTHIPWQEPLLDSDSSESKESSDEELIGPPLPHQGSAEDSDNELIGPPLPPGYKGSEEEEDEDDEDENIQEEEEDPVKKIPDSHEITLHHGTKTVSALGLDPSGARLITGGYDYDVRFWDFAGMDASLQAFRSLQPCECHQIKSLQYSSTGDVILVVAGNSQAKVLDRDGFPVMECVKGDQYIVDMANTKVTCKLSSHGIKSGNPFIDH